MLHLGELLVEAPQGAVKGGSAVANSSCPAIQWQAVLNYTIYVISAAVNSRGLCSRYTVALTHSLHSEKGTQEITYTVLTSMK